MSNDIELLDNKDIDRVEGYFKRLYSLNRLNSLFKPNDTMMFTLNKQLITFSKKDLLQEVFRRREIKRKDMIKKKLLELGKDDPIT
jgi:hypothetical protein